MSVAGNTLTGDALYYQRDYCQQARDAGGDYLASHRETEPGALYDDIARAFAEPTAAGRYRKTATCNQHGARWEVRQLPATTALNDNLDWPDVGAVRRITRRTRGTAPTDGPMRYGITSRDGKVEPATLLHYARGHWEIANRLRYARDVTLGEEASPLRKGSAPQVMAILRNIVVSALRRGGENNIAAALRRIGWTPGEPLRSLGLAFP